MKPNVPYLSFFLSIVVGCSSNGANPAETETDAGVDAAESDAATSDVKPVETPDGASPSPMDSTSDVSSDTSDPNCDRRTSWSTEVCKQKFLTEREMLGYTSCGDPSVLGPDAVKAACPMGSSILPPGEAKPLRCDVDIRVNARAEFYCKGSGKERLVVGLFFDQFEAPAAVPMGKERLSISSTQLCDFGSTGGTISASRNEYAPEVGALFAVAAAGPFPPSATVRRLWNFASTTTLPPTVDGGPPSFSPPSYAWFGMASHKAPK